MESALFGITLRKLRKDAGLSQRELGRIVNVGDTYISRLENNLAQCIPSPDLLNRIAIALNCDRAELFQAAGRLEPWAIAEYETSLSAIAQRLDTVIIAMFGDDAAWTYHAGVVAPPKEYDRAESWLADLWLAREEANSAIHWVQSKLEESAIK